MSTRRERAERRNSVMGRLRAGICSNCGQRGSHFIPPCFGDPGFFTCDPVEQITDPDGNEAEHGDHEPGECQICDAAR